MIKATDLRIGNLITDVWATLDKCGWPINKFTNKRVWYGDFVCHLENALPVVLTEEWLMKFGFTETYKSEYTHRFGHSTLIEIDFKFNLAENTKGFIYKGLHIDCEYVHQLQNITHSLTGEELTPITK